MIELKDSHFVIDGKPFYVYSGELHYFRVEPRLWDTHLRRAKEAGLNTVSSYVPWSWHEAEEGRFDFTGKTHPRKDLAGFLKKVKAHGLKFIARVGPVSNAEMVNEGVPGWLLKVHPEVSVQGKEVTNLPHVTLLSYLNETFRDYAGKWDDNVLPVIRGHQWPDGNIILVQLDNEIGMVHWLNKAADYSPGTERLYREYLKRKYSSIEKLNAAYGESYRDFSAVSQPLSGSDTQAMNLLWDWMGFYQHYYALYFDFLYKKFKSHSLTLPVLANIPQFYDFDVRGRGVFSPMTTMMFKDFKRMVPECVFGGAYQMRRLDYENFHDIAITSEVVKMITSPGVPSICAELQTGIMRDRPKLYPADVALNLRTSAAHDLNAVNCYMFSGGKNDPEFGAFGTYHDWQAPVGPGGDKRSHFSELKDFGKFIKAFGREVSATKKSVDTAIGFYSPLYTTEYLTGPEIELWEWKKMQLFYDGLARLLQVANINYTFVDLKDITLSELKQQQSLWVFSLEFMDAATQQKLIEYVTAGGTLLLNPDLPEKDLGFSGCTILADQLGIKKVSRRTKHLFYYIGRQDYLAQGQITTFTAADPSRSRVLATDEDGAPCGLEIARGKGMVFLLGFGLNHMFDYQVTLIKDIARAAGINPAVEAGGETSAVVRKNSDLGFLFLANYHDEPRRTALRLVLPGETRTTKIPSAGTVALANRRCYILPLNVPLFGGESIRYSTVEVLEWKRSYSALVLIVKGNKGANAEIELVTSRRSALVEGTTAVIKRKKGKLLIRFRLTGEDQRIRVSA